MTLALAAVLVAFASPSSQLVQAGAKFQRVGEFRVTANPTMRGAVDAFGKPSSCTVGPFNHAVGRWTTLGVRIEFWTYSMRAGVGACRDPEIWVSEIWITGRRYRTSYGLRVGDSDAKLRRLYPRAIYRRHDARTWGWPSAYVLVGDRRPRLFATVRAGRVTALVLPVFAQGE